MTDNPTDAMSHLRQLKKRTSGLLTELGTSADDVAASLGRAGIAGIPKSNRSCAIALYLTAVIGGEPGIRSVAVGPCSVVINLVAPTDSRPAGRLLVQLPKPVRQFVAAFDGGQFPAIERHPAVRASEVTGAR
jgi:hypothetical protein